MESECVLFRHSDHQIGMNRSDAVLNRSGQLRIGNTDRWRLNSECDSLAAAHETAATRGGLDVDRGRAVFCLPTVHLRHHPRRRPSLFILFEQFRVLLGCADAACALVRESLADRFAGLAAGSFDPFDCEFCPDGCRCLRGSRRGLAAR